MWHSSKQMPFGGIYYLAVSDLLGVHVRGENKISNELTPNQMKLKLENGCFYKLGEDDNI
jgi:hypothetical protein